MELHTCATGYWYCSGKKHLLNFRCLLLGKRRNHTYGHLNMAAIQGPEASRLEMVPKRTESPQCSGSAALSDVLFVLRHEVTALFDIPH